MRAKKIAVPTDKGAQSSNCDDSLAKQTQHNVSVTPLAAVKEETLELVSVCENKPDHKICKTSRHRRFTATSPEETKVSSKSDEEGGMSSVVRTSSSELRGSKNKVAVKKQKVLVKQEIGTETSPDKTKMLSTLNEEGCVSNGASNNASELTGSKSKVVIKKQNVQVKQEIEQCAESPDKQQQLTAVEKPLRKQQCVIRNTVLEQNKEKPARCSGKKHRTGKKIKLATCTAVAEQVTKVEGRIAVVRTESKKSRKRHILEEHTAVEAETKRSTQSRKAKMPKMEKVEKTGELTTVGVRDARSSLTSTFFLSPPPTSGGKYVGAHVSISGGLYKSVLEALEIGARAMGLFLRSQRTWLCKPLSDDDAKKFRETLAESGINRWMLVPHGSYLLNSGAADADVLRKTRETLVDELQRCEKLGLPIYNFHPGSAKGQSSRTACIETIAETINYVHSKTSNVITVVENMSGQGNTIGGQFSELRMIIDRVTDQSRIGVCLDTCHMFAAGYDIESEQGYEQMKAEFDSVVGRKYLRAVHLNDSKGKLGCHLDRHENIGKGALGTKTFCRIMNDPFFDDVPMVLETPFIDYRMEIDLLNSLVKK